MVVTSHMASCELLCFSQSELMSIVVRRYLWELQLSSPEGIMRMVLLRLHRGRMGRMGPMCPPATPLLLPATALGLGEAIALHKFSNIDHS